MRAVVGFRVVCELTCDGEDVATARAQAGRRRRQDAVNLDAGTGVSELLTSRLDASSPTLHIVPAVDTNMAAPSATAEIHVELSEFAVLDDGRRLLIRNDRGLGLGPNRFDIWRRWSRDRLTRFICDYIVEDHDENPAICDWIMGRLTHSRQLVIDGGSLRAILCASPTVEFGDNILSRWREFAT